ncbi:hypothetical protein FQN60_011431 [Etheostoma spectabile]|uniref:Uncharacterized protein n=1 Tax=Etheostoma spectabile TaxID=54343 RepID=A0A5J5DS48_9PERO|nr:hypothetical protein FQN60_011431 [Etheostoma spectabile]
MFRAVFRLSPQGPGVWLGLYPATQPIGIQMLLHGKWDG